MAWLEACPQRLSQPTVEASAAVSAAVSSDGSTGERSCFQTHGRGCWQDPVPPWISARGSLGSLLRGGEGRGLPTAQLTASEQEIKGGPKTEATGFVT